jgi:hypothetical protein
MKDTEDLKIAVSTKLKPEQHKKLADLCSFGDVSQSVFIRGAILEKLESPAVQNVAGKNKFEYVKENDSFDWVVELEDGSEKILVHNISKEFLDQLTSEANKALNDRNDLLGKKSKNSVAVPRRLLK